MNKEIIKVLLVAMALGLGLFNNPSRAASLLENGNLEIADPSGTWPTDWPKAEGVKWEKEKDGRFFRLVQTTPGKMVMLHRSIVIPDGITALRLSFRTRYSNVVPGEKPWFDGTFIVNFKDAASGGQQINPSPNPSHFQGTSKGWVEYSMILVVPAGAHALEIMPGLFNAISGTLDIDDIAIEAATDEEVTKLKISIDNNRPLPVPPTETPLKEKWPEELFVVGNRLHTKSGREIWLQGIVTPSLEWSAKGENALASAKIAIEEWKGNILRLEVRDDFWFGKGPDQNDGGAEYRALVDAAINLAANRGVYTMLDLHRYRAVRPEHVTFWKDAATIYKNHPAVLFDIFNEPHSISWEVWRNGGAVEEKTQRADEDNFLSDEEKKKSATAFQSPGMQAVVNAIRATGAKNIIVAAGIGWSYDLSAITKGYALEDKDGHGIVYGWHVYNWHKDWEKNMLETAAKYPILVGECGADPNKMDFVPAGDQEDPYTWSPKFIGFVQKHRLNWTAFSFHPHCTPVLILDWKFTPSPSWGALVKEALAGRQFEYQGSK